MTTERRRQGPATTDSLVVGLALATAVALVLAAGGATAVASAQSGGDPGETALTVVLPETPDGLAGYQLTLEVDGATVTGASYPDAYQPTTEPSISSDGQSVALEAADVSDGIQAGDGDVTLATVTVEGLDGEQPGVSVTDAAIDADGGDRIDPDSVTVSVEGSDGTDVRTGNGSDDESTDGSTDGASEDGGETPGADGPGFGVLAAAVGGLLGIGTILRRR